MDIYAISVGFEANTGDTSIYKNSEVATARTAFLSM